MLKIDRGIQIPLLSPTYWDPLFVAHNTLPFFRKYKLLHYKKATKYYIIVSRFQGGVVLNEWERPLILRNNPFKE